MKEPIKRKHSLRRGFAYLVKKGAPIKKNWRGKVTSHFRKPTKVIYAYAGVKSGLNYFRFPNTKDNRDNTFIILYCNNNIIKRFKK